MCGAHDRGQGALEVLNIHIQEGPFCLTGVCVGEGGGVSVR